MSIRLEKVVKSFPGTPTPILKSIDLEISDSEFVALTGRSGSGKSTLLYVMSSLDFATSGRVELDGEEPGKLDSKSLHRLRNQKIGFVFQFHYLLPELTALENVLIPARKCKRHLELTSRARALLAEFDIADKEKRFPGQLSGGEQQRVAIARALVMSPRYLFADEPTGNLDSASGDKVMKIFQRINQETKTTVVYVTHDPDYAALAHRQVQLVDGAF